MFYTTISRVATTFLLWLQESVPPLRSYPPVSKSDIGQWTRIRRQPVDLPVAIARRLGTVAAGDFLGAFDRMLVAFGAACSGLGQRPLRGRRQWALGRHTFFGFSGRGRFARLFVSGHGSQLAHAPRGRKRS